MATSLTIQFLCVQFVIYCTPNTLVSSLQRKALVFATKSYMWWYRAWALVGKTAVSQFLVLERMIWGLVLWLSPSCCCSASVCIIRCRIFSPQDTEWSWWSFMSHHLIDIAIERINKCNYSTVKTWTPGEESTLPVWKARAQSFLHVSEKDIRAKCETHVWLVKVLMSFIAFLSWFCLVYRGF